MVVNNENNMDINQIKYSFRRKGGKSIIERCPVFTPDGELLSVIVENTVRFYNKQTGDCVRTLETESFSGDLVAIEYPPSESYNLYGCSVNGDVTVWTWQNGGVLREVKLNIGGGEGTKILTFNVLSTTECLITVGYPNRAMVRLATFSLKTGQVVTDFSGTQPTFYDMVKVAVGSYNGQKFAALINGTKMVFVQDLTHDHIRDQHINSNNMRIVAVSAHSNGSIAYTDALGRLTVMRGNFFNRQHNIAREVLHWHFLPPLAITHSLEGSYIYSGGLEKVLVKWTLGNVAHTANEKIFMPRLPGNIRFITTSSTHVAVTLSNNAIVISDTQLYAKCTILECGGLSPVMRAVGGSLLYCNRLGCLVMPGRIGFLQFYSTKTDKVLFNMDITGMNDLPAERYDLIPLDTEVTCAAMDSQGNWLVTSEYRNDGINYPEERLKFWMKNIQPGHQSPFLLNTCVNLSHGGCNVVSISLNDRGDFCITAGGDQKFRIWKVEDISRTNQKKIVWTCITACYFSSGSGLYLSHDIFNRVKEHDQNRPDKAERYPYLTKPEENVLQKLINVHKEHEMVDESIIKLGMKSDLDTEMGGTAISMDGSLIAAWFGCKLTLWDTHLCSIRTVLSNPILRPKGHQVLFGNKDASHYLVCTSENALVVWSLLSCTIKWYVKMRPMALAADKLSNRMAVVTDTNDVIIFTPHSSKPVLCLNRLLEPETGVFKQLVFNSSQNGEMILYLMRNNSEIYSIEPSETSGGRLEAISWNNKPGSAFSAMLASRQVSAVKAALPSDTSAAPAGTPADVAQLTSAACYMVPPVSMLCTSFLQQISGQKRVQKPDEQPEDAPKEVEESSDDEEILERNGPRITPRINELWTPNYDAVKQKKLNKINREPFIDLPSTSTLFGI